LRAGAALVCLAAAGLGVLHLPWPGACTAPGIIEYRDSVVVRAQSPGFVTAIHVQDGQFVEDGAALLEMSNDELEAEARDLEVAISQSETRRRIHLEKYEQAAAQVELENQRALKKRLAEKRRQLDGLTCHAPISGSVMARNLDALLMTYLEEGAEILAIGDDTCKRLRVSIAQEDTPLFRSHRAQPVRLRLRSCEVSQGRLSRVVPRASKTPPHFALCAPLGGPLAVAKHDSAESEDSYEFVLPRFTGIVDLPQSVSANLRAGESGYVTIGAARSESVSQVLNRRLRQWFEKKLDDARTRFRMAE
jgi:putative peptide zinc metalloprotease protein